MPDLALAQRTASAWGAVAGPLIPRGDGRRSGFEVRFADGRIALMSFHDSDQKPGLPDRMQWIEALADTGFACPWPQRTIDKLLVVDLGTGAQAATMMQKLPGQVPELPQATDARQSLFFGLGEFLADFHLSADAVDGDKLGPARAGLTGSGEVLERHCRMHPQFPSLSPERKNAVLDVVKLMASTEHQGSDGSGTIHGDFSLRRVLLDNGQFYLTGFGKAGYGHRMCDLAFALLDIWHAPDFPILRAALLSGYCEGGGMVYADTESALDISLAGEALKATVEDALSGRTITPMNGMDRAASLALALLRGPDNRTHQIDL